VYRASRRNVLTADAGNARPVIFNSMGSYRTT